MKTRRQGIGVLLSDSRQTLCLNHALIEVPELVQRDLKLAIARQPFTVELLPDKRSRTVVDFLECPVTLDLDDDRMLRLTAKLQKTA